MFLYFIPLKDIINCGKSQISEFCLLFDIKITFRVIRRKCTKCPNILVWFGFFV